MKQSGFERKQNLFTDEYGQESAHTIQKEKFIPDQENVRTIVDVARTKMRRKVFKGYMNRFNTDLTKVDEEKGESGSSVALSVVEEEKEDEEEKKEEEQEK